MSSELSPAWRQLLPHLCRTHRRVVEWLTAHPGGYTGAELNSGMGPIEVDVSKQMSYMSRIGLLSRLEVRTCRISGWKATAWELAATPPSVQDFKSGKYSTKDVVRRPLAVQIADRDGNVSTLTAATVSLHEGVLLLDDKPTQHNGVITITHRRS